MVARPDVEEIIEYRLRHGGRAARAKYGLSKNFINRVLAERGTNAYRLMDSRVMAAVDERPYTARQLAERLGITVSRVEHILARLGYRKLKSRTHDLDRKVAAEHQLGRRSPAEIASVINAHPSSVARSMKRQGFRVVKMGSVGDLIAGYPIPNARNVTAATRVMARAIGCSRSTVRRAMGLTKWNYRQKLSATTTGTDSAPLCASSG